MAIGFLIGEMFLHDDHKAKSQEMAGVHKTLFEGELLRETIVKVGVTEDIRTVGEPIFISGTTIRMVMVEKNGISKPALIADLNLSNEKIKSATSVKTIYYIHSGSTGYTSFFLIE
ncbi:MAG: hypothetical protein PHU57_05160 [Patescibacteria group bacterium]|nr:hypothetical protein [Patescibacteria group bacterium]